MKKILLFPMLQAVLLTIMLGACKKAEIDFFDGPSAIGLDGVDNIREILQNQEPISTEQQLVYNFAFSEETVVKDTIRIPIRTLGKGAAVARPVSVRVVADGTTAVEGEDFILLPTAIAAHDFKGNIEVVLLRTPKLKTSNQQVSVELLRNDVFPKYIYRDTVNVYKKVSIKFTDIFQKPEEWDGAYFFGSYNKSYGLHTQFGTYSEAKFRMIIEVFGTANITPPIFSIFGIRPGFSTEQWRNYILKLQQELINYRLEHGKPKEDEFGNEIVIPSFNL